MKRCVAKWALAAGFLVTCTPLNGQDTTGANRSDDAQAQPAVNASVPPGVEPVVKSAASPVEVRAARLAITVPTETELATLRQTAESQHALAPALRIALDSYEHIWRDVRDYECTFMRRERVDGVLGPHEYLKAKVRHHREMDSASPVPFSVYMKFLKPSTVRDREVLFVDGKYHNQLVVRNGGPSFGYVVTELRPTSNLAMRGNRYPITEFGFENLLKRLIEVAQEDIERGTPCEVKFYEQAKVDGRPCTGVLVIHPEREPDSRFHMARVFMDREHQIPLLFESYDWPAAGGDSPVLLEQYAYSDVRLNVGLVDSDFDRDNPAYQLSAPERRTQP